MNEKTEYETSRQHFIDTGKLNPPIGKEWDFKIGPVFTGVKISTGWTWGEVTHNGYLRTTVVGVSFIDSVDGIKALQILLGPVMIMASLIKKETKK
jgi:hypothetical protein